MARQKVRNDMTKGEAIKYLNEFILFKKISNTTEEEAVECFKLAVEALKTQPSEDCISRKAVLDSLHRYFAEGFNEDRWWNSTYVLDAINKAPSVTPQSKEEPQPKTGHWIEHQGTFRPHIECSECSCWFLREDLPRNSYCPNCGSRNHWEWELKMQEVKK